MDADAGDVTGILAQMKAGAPDAEARLLEMVYRELRHLAAGFMRRERPDHTLQPTALVHEAYLKLTGHRSIDWQSRGHFFAVAAQVMRRLLVDYARARNTAKRPCGRTAVRLENALMFAEQRSTELLELDQALSRLAAWDPRQAKVVELRFFAGLSLEETAEALGVSARTVKRDWTMARAWLFSEISRTAAHDTRTLDPA